MGHALCNKKTYLMATAFMGKLEAKRKKGRPAASILTNINSKTGMPLGALVYLAEDRRQWHKMKRFVIRCSSNTDDDDGNTDK